MLRRMMLLAMAAGVLVAFAVPALAQADVLRSTEGGPVEPGARVEATTTAFYTDLSYGKFYCGQTAYYGEVIANPSEEGAVVIEERKPLSFEAETECAAYWKSFEFGTLSLDKQVALAPEAQAELVNSCTFSDILTFTYEYGDDALTLDPTQYEMNPEQCGVAKFIGTFTLKLDDGTPLEITEE